MPNIIKPILICEIFKQNNAQLELCYISELCVLQISLDNIKSRKISSKLNSYCNELAIYYQKYGLGIIPKDLNQTRLYIEELYIELLTNNIALPPPRFQNDLTFTFKEFEAFKSSINIHEEKLAIPQQSLTFFAKYLPFFGTLIALTIIAGITVSSLTTLLGWEWSLFLFSIFGLCKFLTSYADIAGGPERRLQAFGFWLDRLRIGIYSQYEKHNLARFLLNSTVIIMLTCSSLLTWYGAWGMLRCISSITVFPNYVASSLAGLFAWASSAANFGRIYYDLYDLLYRLTSFYISYDNIVEDYKLSLAQLKLKIDTGLLNVPLNINNRRTFLTHYENRSQSPMRSLTRSLSNPDFTLDTNLSNLTQSRLAYTVRT